MRSIRCTSSPRARRICSRSSGSWYGVCEPPGPVAEGRAVEHQPPVGRQVRARAFLACTQSSSTPRTSRSLRGRPLPHQPALVPVGLHERLDEVLARHQQRAPAPASSPCAAGVRRRRPAPAPASRSPSASAASRARSACTSSRAAGRTRAGSPGCRPRTRRGPGRGGSASSRAGPAGRRSGSPRALAGVRPDRVDADPVEPGGDGRLVDVARAVGVLLAHVRLEHGEARLHRQPPEHLVRQAPSGRGCPRPPCSTASAPTRAARLRRTSARAPTCGQRRCRPPARRRGSRRWVTNGST